MKTMFKRKRRRSAFAKRFGRKAKPPTKAQIDARRKYLDRRGVTLTEEERAALLKEIEE